MSAPTAPRALVLTRADRPVRRARGGRPGENGIGGRAFIEHFDAKLRRDLLQSRRESVQFEQVEGLGEPVTAAAYPDYAQTQRFDPPDEIPCAAAGKPQRRPEPLAGVKPAVGQQTSSEKEAVPMRKIARKNRTN